MDKVPQLQSLMRFTREAGLWQAVNMEGARLFRIGERPSEISIKDV